MSLRHAVLGLLASEPSTGYELAQKFDRSLANAWHASHSQIYPELGKLQEEGLVEVVGEGARRSRTFAVTAAGRDELRRWLLQPDPPRYQRNPTVLRWFLLPLLSPADRRAVLEVELAYLAEHQALLGEIDALIRAAPEGSPFHPPVTLGLRINEVTDAWLREQLDALDDA